METEIVSNLIVLAVSMVFLLKGADAFLDSSIKLARHYGISELIISLTLVSLATSLPELGVSMISALIGNSSFSVSNIVGSGIVNICIIIGVPALFVTTQVHRKVIERDCIALVVAYLMLLAAFVSGSTNMFIGIAFLIAYLVYLYYLYHHNKKEEVVKEEDSEVWKQFGILALGVLGVYVGSHFSVEAAINLSRAAGLSEWFIGATMLAFGTSLPELSVVFQAMRKKKAVMSIGTAIGSNVFNVLVIIGAASIVTPLTLAFEEIWFDLIVLIASAVVLTARMSLGQHIGKKDGYYLLLLYCMYLLYLFFFRLA